MCEIFSFILSVYFKFFLSAPINTFSKFDENYIFYEGYTQRMLDSLLILTAGIRKQTAKCSTITMHAITVICMISR